jgi:hypothetical protein
MKGRLKEKSEGHASWLSIDKFVYYLLLLVPVLSWLFVGCTGGGGGGSHP